MESLNANKQGDQKGEQRATKAKDSSPEEDSDKHIFVIYKNCIVTYKLHVCHKLRVMYYTQKVHTQVRAYGNRCGDGKHLPVMMNEPMAPSGGK